LRSYFTFNSNIQYNYHSATLSKYSGALRSDGNDIGSPIAASLLQDDIELDPELLAIQQSIKQREGNSSQSVDTKVEILVKPKHHLGTSITDENEDIYEYEKPIKFIIKTVSIMAQRKFYFLFFNVKFYQCYYIYRKILLSN